MPPNDCGTKPYRLFLPDADMSESLLMTLLFAALKHFNKLLQQTIGHQMLKAAPATNDWGNIKYSLSFVCLPFL